jgi:hypothetical protein
MRIIGKQVHYGTYGRLMNVDEDGNEIETKVEVQKRSKRGRPRKNETSEGKTMEVTPQLYHAFGLL